MNFEITLTWSKIMATLILGCAVYLDIRNGGSQNFSLTLPVIIVLITGKQVVDWKKKDDAKV